MTRRSVCHPCEGRKPLSGRVLFLLPFFRRFVPPEASTMSKRKSTSTSLARRKRRRYDSSISFAEPVQYHFINLIVDILKRALGSRGNASK